MRVIFIFDFLSLIFYLSLVSLVPLTVATVGMIFALGSLVPLAVWPVLVARRLFQGQTASNEGDKRESSNGCRHPRRGQPSPVELPLSNCRYLDTEIRNAGVFLDDGVTRQWIVHSRMSLVFCLAGKGSSA